MDKKELKPCPFCGEEAELEDWTCAWESGTTIGCVGCNARIVEGVVDGDGWHDRAVEKWNRRTAAHARIAELEAELDAQNDEFVQRLAEKSAEIECLQSQYKEAMNLLEFAMEQLALAAR